MEFANRNYEKKQIHEAASVDNGHILKDTMESIGKIFKKIFEGINMSPRTLWGKLDSQFYPFSSEIFELEKIKLFDLFFEDLQELLEEKQYCDHATAQKKEQIV